MRTLSKFRSREFVISSASNPDTLKASFLTRGTIEDECEIAAKQATPYSTPSLTQALFPFVPPLQAPPQPPLTFPNLTSIGHAETWSSTALIHPHNTSVRAIPFTGFSASPDRNAALPESSWILLLFRGIRMERCFKLRTTMAT